MEIQRNMAAVMRAMKKESGKSMSEFSLELEISRSTLQEYLSGKGNPNATTIDHLARKLGVDVSFLISGSFSDGQLEVLLKLLDMLTLLSGLDPERRKQFAGLLLQMIELWDGSDGNA